MALSTKVQGIPRDDGAPIWSMDMVTWWPQHELLKDSRFREVSSPGYLDYVAVLDPEEARALAARFRKRCLSHDRPQAATLAALLKKKPPELCWVLVNVYEWESGLG